MNVRWFAIVGLGLLAQACGGDDPPPVCPTGNCTLPGSTIVKWKFNHYPELKFDSDSCMDVQAAAVRVDVTGIDDPTFLDSLEKSCGEGQLTFIDLPLGQHTFAVTPLDLDGNPLVSAPVVVMGAAGSPGANETREVVVPHTAWTRAYTGQFLYRLAWGGQSCAMATPAVTQQTVTLTIGGQAVTQVNNRGDKMDGSTDYPCWPLTSEFPQSVMGLRFGPATFRVVGKDDADVVLFDTTFDTFVGAGTFNPTLTFDATAVPPPV